MQDCHDHSVCLEKVRTSQPPPARQRGRGPGWPTVMGAHSGDRAERWNLGTGASQRQHTPCHGASDARNGGLGSHWSATRHVPRAWHVLAGSLAPRTLLGGFCQPCVRRRRMADAAAPVVLLAWHAWRPSRDAGRGYKSHQPLGRLTAADCALQLERLPPSCLCTHAVA